MTEFLKLITISTLLLCFVVSASGQSQDAGDFTNTAMQLSQSYRGGSARIQALGGAQTALGGDISSISSNPAGLGFFNRSEFSFSPSFNTISTKSTFLGQSTTDSRLNFNFANLGAVINKTKGDLVDSKWRGGSFGISINRIVDFQNQIFYEGENTLTDFIDYAVDTDNFFTPNDLSDLAFETFLTDEFYELYNGQQNISINGVDYNVESLYGTGLTDGDTLFFVDRNIYDINDPNILGLPSEDFPSLQKETINSTGAVYKTSFSYGGNYDDKLYIGASLGFMTVNKEVERTYTERPTDSDLSSLVLTDNYQMSGAGVNGTFGIIYRPAQPVLLGLTYTTPTYYILEQSREIELTANFIDETFVDGIIYAPFDYSISTPARLSGGVTYFFGKNGFLTADVEKVNYSRAKLGNATEGISFSDFNQDIEQFESVFNYRLGAEYRYDMFRFRAGYAYLEDPINGDGLDQSSSNITFGGGIRTKEYYIDLGMVSSFGKESGVTPYPTAESTVIKNTNFRTTISVGFFF